MNLDFFNYTIYLAFKVANSHQRITKLNLKELMEFRKEIAKKLDEKYSDIILSYDKLKDRLNDYLKFNYEMKKGEELIYFLLLVKKYRDIFNSDGVSISISAPIHEFHDIESDMIKNKEDKVIFSFLDEISESPDLLKILGANTISEDVEKLANIESLIENAYQNHENEEAKNTIRVCNVAMLHNLKRIIQLPKEDINLYSNVIFEKALDGYINNPFFILSETLEKRSNIYKSNKYIEDELGNLFQQAIFDNNSLAYEQLNNYMNTFWEGQLENEELEIDEELLDDEENDSFDDDIYYEEEIDFDYDKTNFIFYANYIDKINYYINSVNNDENLLNAKNRLLYTLNPFGCNLYEERNYNIISNKLKNKDNYKNTSFDDFYIISMLFLEDILNEWLEEKDTLLKKILFISTYYDITNDKRILDYINGYIDKPIGKKVYAAITNHVYTHFNTNDKKKTFKKEKM